MSETGFYVFGNLTDTGRLAVAGVTETGRYYTAYPESSGYTVSFSGGVVFSASMLKKQIPFATVTPTATVFTLTDASTNFKLEQQP